MRRYLKKNPLARYLYRSTRAIRWVFTRLRRIWDLWHSENSRFVDYYQPGHYYSPIPDYPLLLADRETLFDRSISELPGIELNTQVQLDQILMFSRHYADFPFTETPENQRRYYLDNEFFSYGDAIALYALVRCWGPKRIVEVGSGFSSALMLDMNDLYFAGQLELTFIEPYPQRLFSLLNEGDRHRCKVLTQPVQQASTEVFEQLRENDILFIDSSHVAKAGSDVVYLVSQILPSLSKGVLIHFHDILWPFQYPQAWFASGRAWNEAYLVRAFLQYNQSFEIIYFNSYLETHYTQLLRERLPLTLKTPSAPLTQGNTSLWLRKG